MVEGKPAAIYPPSSLSEKDDDVSDGIHPAFGRGNVGKLEVMILSGIDFQAEYSIFSEIHITLCKVFIGVIFIYYGFEIFVENAVVFFFLLR